MRLAVLSCCHDTTGGREHDPAHAALLPCGLQEIESAYRVHLDATLGIGQAVAHVGKGGVMADHLMDESISSRSTGIDDVGTDAADFASDEDALVCQIVLRTG